MLIDIINFQHFIPLSLTLTLPGGHKVSSAKQNIGLIFSHTFHMVGMKSNVVRKQFKLNSQRLLLSKI